MERHDLHLLALVKGQERYVFIYTADQRDMLFQVLTEFVGNPELSLTGYDAAVLSQFVHWAPTVPRLPPLD